jgi:hypothetical protein
MTRVVPVAAGAVWLAACAAIAGLNEEYTAPGARAPDARDDEAAAREDGADESSLPSDVSPGGPKPTVIAANEARPTSLTLAGGVLYWVNEVSNGAIRSCAASGCTTPASIPSHFPHRLGIFGTNVYWTDSNDNAIYEQNLLGGPPSTLRPATKPLALALGALELVWSDSNQVAYCQQSNCAATSRTLAPMQQIATGVAIDALQIYWPDGTQISYCGITGSCITAKTGAFVSNVHAEELLAFGGLLYWTDPVANTVVGCKADFDTGCPAPMSAQTRSPRGVAVDKTGVYWASFDDGTILGCASLPCTPRVLATGQDHPVSLALDESHVYWTNYGSTETNGAVMSVPKF